MDTVFQALLSWQLLFACLSIAAATFVFRKIVEYFIAVDDLSPKMVKLWTDLVLPTFPMIFGSVASAIFKGLPFPDGITTASARFACGLVAGLLSGLVFRVVKSFLGSKVGIQTDNCDNDDLINQVRGSINKD